LSGDFDTFKNNVKTNDLSVNNISVNSENNIRFLSDVSFNQNVNITGNLIIDGSFNFNEVIQNITTVNNEILISSQLDISNQGTGPALSVTQYGDSSDDNLLLLHGGTDGSAVEIKGDGKAIFYKDVSFNGHISGTDASIISLSVKKLMGYSPIEVMHDLCLNTRLIVKDASFTTIQTIGDTLNIIGDLSINGDISSQIITADKILYSNVYPTVDDLPNASTYHGMFAHVHSTGAAYFSHAGGWIQLAKNSDINSGGGGGGGGADSQSVTDISNRLFVNSAATSFSAHLLADISSNVTGVLNDLNSGAVFNWYVGSDNYQDAVSSHDDKWKESIRGVLKDMGGTLHFKSLNNFAIGYSSPNTSYSKFYINGIQNSHAGGGSAVRMNAYQNFVGRSNYGYSYMYGSTAYLSPQYNITCSKGLQLQGVNNGSSYPSITSRTNSTYGLYLVGSQLYYKYRHVTYYWDDD
tara:strand:+ start:61 stop:1458 length:1398 start_codon:yes stop_codon:yes gene_type:complete